MKKRLLMFLMIVAVVAAGIIAGSARAVRNVRRTSWPAAIITSQLTEYGAQGQVISNVTVIRNQYSDGRWTQDVADRGDGKAFHSRGQVNLANVPTIEECEWAAAEFGRKEAQLLGYRVFIQKNEREEFWHSPELDAILKEVRYNPDGSISYKTEATAVVVGEPK